MPLPTSDASKKNSARDIIAPAYNVSGQYDGAWELVNSTSYSNKQAALDAIDDLYDAYLAAISAIESLS